MILFLNMAISIHERPLISTHSFDILFYLTLVKCDRTQSIDF